MSRSKNISIYTSVLIILCITSFSLSASTNNKDGVKEDEKVVKAWNDFVDNVYQLHLKQIKDRNIKTQAQSGGYYQLPYFYQEIKFFDEETDKLLSRVEWETRNPDRLHGIEVHVHDDNNRLVREYFASYLPTFRNAPYQTLINLHHYNNNLHSFRQFDASDNLIYEVCVDTSTDKKIYEHDDYEIPDNKLDGVAKEKSYQQCFSQLPRSAGLALKPY